MKYVMNSLYILHIMNSDCDNYHENYDNYENYHNCIMYQKQKNTKTTKLIKLNDINIIKKNNQIKYLVTHILKCWI